MHGHGHGHGTLLAEPPPRRSERERRQEQRARRRALILMTVILLPFGVATLAGMVLLWPDGTKRPAPDPASAFAVPGVSFLNATVTGVKPVSCGADGSGSAGGAGGTGGNGRGATCGQVSARLASGPEQGRERTFPVSTGVFQSGINPGDEVKLVRIPPGDGVGETYAFADFERELPVTVLAVAFAVVVVGVARLRGLAALAGLVLACLVLVRFVLPALLAGESALMVGLVGSSAIMFVVLYLAHGFSARTTTALLGTLFGLAVTAGLGLSATGVARLTGLGSEDNLKLTALNSDLQLSGIVLCGLLIAGLGVLNDVTVTQASAVWELHETAPQTASRPLFTAAMRIGRDHIASTVYTIAFAYVGAALPVLLLISTYQQSLRDALFSEALAEELVRTLVASIGLVLAIPLTTLIAVMVVKSVGRRSAAPSGSPTVG